jgi:hypothetical protein
MKFDVWGYTDDSPDREVLLESFDDIYLAIYAAKQNGMATAVICNETGREYWPYPSSDR